MAIFLVLLAVVLFAGGIIYVNEYVYSYDGKVGFGVCVVGVTLCLLAMAAFGTH